jgi:hypothetical protein
LLVVGAGVWAFWLDPECSVVEAQGEQIPLPAAAE